MNNTEKDLIEISLSKTSLVETNLYHAPSAWQQPFMIFSPTLN